MIRTLEAIVDEQGRIRPLESIGPGEVRRALVTILDEEPRPARDEAARLSEAALAEDWCREEEDQAWSHLQAGR